MLCLGAPSFNPMRPRLLINKSIEIERADKTLDRAIKEGITNLLHFETMIKNLKRQFDVVQIEADKYMDALNRSRARRAVPKWFRGRSCIRSHPPTLATSQLDETYASGGGGSNSLSGGNAGSENEVGMKAIT
ncbi:hypothetical protein MRB53_010551 [Persea americana]|uniref:Uncharacterized protein n=1 Tax=Persea americana TaxID=3435 RepID=A0ACC2LTB1_PERAE|nr:hypothetical protein MRB53_010551 [Persea americana]